MKQTCILILGMHRSGTSALTGTLGLLDIDLGNNLMTADEDNEKGYFENQNFYNINENLLAQINSSWEDIFFDESKLSHIKDTDELKRILKNEFEKSSIFAIKDPRLAYLFPVYEKVLKELNIDIKIIIPYRNPIEVATSLESRNHFSLEKGMLLWLYHILLSEKFSRNYKRVFIEFNELISNTKNVIQVMSKELELDFNSAYNKNKKDISDFLDPGIKHHNISIDDLPSNTPKIIRDILSQRSAFNTNVITSKFDTWREELFAYQKLFYNQNTVDTFMELTSVKEKLHQTENTFMELTSVKEKLHQIENTFMELDSVKEELHQTKDTFMELNSAKEILQQTEDTFMELNSIKEMLSQAEKKTIILNQQIQEKEDYIDHLQELVQSLRLKNRLKNIVPKKAREVLHILKHSFKNPVKLLKVMDKQYANKLFKHIKQGNFSYILERMGHYINQEPSNIHLSLMSGYSTEEVLTFPVTAAPKVSIIIPVYNQFDYTHRCLRSILQFTNNIDYEIIIADDVSSDTTQNIHEYIKNIKVVRNKKNLGFLLNCNNAAKEAKGEYIFFLNNDTNVQKDWLSTLLETIENDSTIGMVGSKLVYPDGRQQEAGGIIWDDASGWNYGRLDNPEKPEYNYVKEVDYISGAAIMIRTELWKEIGGFDERYVPAYYEDTDLAFEVRKHGYKVILQPKSVVVHFEGISNGTDTSSGLKQYQIVNKDKFYDKWKELLKKEHFKNGQNIFTARDKSVNKKTLLFIDHYVPHFDQDAGSRATLHYLELFKKHDMNVKFLGDNFYHYPETPYVTTLEDMGIEVLYGGYYARNWENWLAENAKNIDYIVLSRPHIATKYIDIVKKYTDAKIIYFAVDLHYLREEREYKIKKDKQILKSSKYWREIEFDLMEKSDLTCFYSYVEVDEIKKENPLLNTIQIPLYIYNEFKEIDYAHKNRQDIMFVGGFTHNPNVDAVVYFVEEVMPKIREKNIPFKVYIVGSNATEQIEVYANQHDDIIVTGRISDEELERLYSSCRLVIAPLRYGAGVKGKVVEALYNGIPLITTSVGAEGLINVESSLKIADNAMEFANAVIEVYSKEELAIDLSKKSIQYCKENFSEKSADKQIFNNGINLLK